MSTPQNHMPKPRERGMTLVEITVAIVVFTVIAIPVSFTLVRGMAHRMHVFQQYLALSALRDLAAEIQETANSPLDLSQQMGIGAVFDKYDGQTFTAPALQNGQITVTCYADEVLVPAALGGPQDLNFDGDPDDDLGNQSNGTDLKLVPMILTITYDDGNTSQQVTFDMHRLIGKTTD